MKQLICICVLTLTSYTVFAQQNFTSSTDSSGQKVLTGQIDEKILANDPAFMWFFTGVNKYQPNAEMEKELTAYKDSFNIVVFMGTWNPASQRLIPEFYKAMLLAGYDQQRITLLAVNHDMKTADGAVQKFHITTLPTFVIMHRGLEVGRIEGKVKVSIEADIVAILDHMMAELGQGKSS